MTLKSGLDKRRSNSLSTRGCGERRQTESLDELDRLVATLLRVGKTAPVGKDLWGRCSRIVTDRLDEFLGRLELGRALSDSSVRRAAGDRSRGPLRLPHSIPGEKA